MIGFFYRFFILIKNQHAGKILRKPVSVPHQQLAGRYCISSGNLHAAINFWRDANSYDCIDRLIREKSVQKRYYSCSWHIARNYYVPVRHTYCAQRGSAGHGNSEIVTFFSGKYSKSIQKKCQLCLVICYWIIYCILRDGACLNIEK